MKTLYLKLLVASVLILTGINQQATACSAAYKHTNACVGDTVWFYGLDLFAVHAWDFGDSTFGKANLAFDDTSFHVYDKAGTYYVTHFVNIGFEWDYQTQVITIGTKCFDADFSTSCYGNLTYLFTNNSIGKNLKSSWNFGDPGSGTNDTSSATTAAHQYPSAGSYTVTLIISDGTNSDTSEQIVNIRSTCMQAQANYLSNPCYTDSAHFYYYFTGVTNVEWNFGDPASGAANYSNSLMPAHLFSAPGIYVGSVTYTDGLDTATLPVYTYVVDCSIFPGDANSDGYVSGEDIFPIALYFVDTGSARLNATTNFTGQQCADWTTMGMYLQAMINAKHADCNGDGKIDATDVDAVTKNFGKVHAKHNTQSEMQMVPPSAPHLSITASKIEYMGFGIEKGSATLSLTHTEGLYGVCATVKYNPIYVNAQTITVSFQNSWLGHQIEWYHNDTAHGLLTIVAARNNQLAKSGHGVIAEIQFDFINNTHEDGTPFNLTILPNAKVMLNSMFPSDGADGYIQSFIKVNLDSCAAFVRWEGVNEIAVKNSLCVFPSPTTDILNIHSDKNLSQATLKVFDATGRFVMTNKVSGNNPSVNVHSFAEGIYLMEVTDGTNVYHQKFMVSK